MAFPAAFDPVRGPALTPELVLAFPPEFGPAPPAFGPPLGAPAGAGEVGAIGGFSEPWLLGAAAYNRATCFSAAART